jgi:hypothetical protein
LQLGLYEETIGTLKGGRSTSPNIVPLPSDSASCALTPGIRGAAGTKPAKHDHADRRPLHAEVRRPSGDAVWSYHCGLLSLSVNEENMMLKLTLILSSSLTFASTECSR